MSALFRSEFYTRMKRYWGENISIYRMRKLLFTILKVKLFLKRGISRQLGRGWTQLFDLNARIQQLTWSLIFYEKYSTSQSYLWFWPPLIILGGSVISTGTIHDLRRVKVPGTGPLWNPCTSIFNETIFHLIVKSTVDILCGAGLYTYFFCWQKWNWSIVAECFLIEYND